MSHSPTDLSQSAGYGSTGPYSKFPGYDVVIEAEAGLMHITGEKEGKPVKVRQHTINLECFRPTPV